jgi:hypothetical protein
MLEWDEGNAEGIADDRTIKMENEDKVIFRSFTQNARDRWLYNIDTQAGKKYEIQYILQPSGFIKEVFHEITGGARRIIWDRDIRAGDNVSQTWEEKVRQG